MKEVSVNYRSWNDERIPCWL